MLAFLEKKTGDFGYLTVCIKERAKNLTDIRLICQTQKTEGTVCRKYVFCQMMRLYFYSLVLLY